MTFHAKQNYCFSSKAAVAVLPKNVAPGTFPDATPTPTARRLRGLGLSAGLRAQRIRSLRDQPTVRELFRKRWGRITSLPPPT
jgi:hypothetical protein